MVPAEARPAGMGRFLRPLLSSADVVVSTSMMSSVMPALACKQDMDRSSVSVGKSTPSVDRSTVAVDRSTLCMNRVTVFVHKSPLSVYVTLQILFHKEGAGCIVFVCMAKCK